MPAILAIALAGSVYGIPEMWEYALGSWLPLHLSRTCARMAGPRCLPCLSYPK